MIKTKSILSSKVLEDETRICIMRWVRDTYDYDEWLVNLAPSEPLLTNYRYNKINWEKFKTGYLEEMKEQKELIRGLKQRSENGEVITLLCWEKNDGNCHRGILKELIEST